jgi:hypothetical protein
VSNVRAGGAILAALGVAVSAGCAGIGGDDGTANHAEVERHLVRDARGTVCSTPGACREFRAERATCEGGGIPAKRRTLYPCRITFRVSAGDRPLDDRGRQVVRPVCAAVDDVTGEVSWGFRDCRRG